MRRKPATVLQVIPGRAAGSATLERGAIRSSVEQNILAGDVTGMHTAQESAGLAELRRCAKALRGNRLLRMPRNLLFGHSFMLCRRAKAAAQALGIKASRQQIVDRDVFVSHGARYPGHEGGQSRAGRTR